MLKWQNRNARQSSEGAQSSSSLSLQTAETIEMETSMGQQLLWQPKERERQNVQQNESQLTAEQCKYTQTMPNKAAYRCCWWWCCSLAILPVPLRLLSPSLNGQQIWNDYCRKFGEHRKNEKGGMAVRRTKGKYTIQKRKTLDDGVYLFICLYEQAQSSDRIITEL